MDREQARRLIAAADALPEEIGRGDVFNCGKPCCAIGHMAVAAGVEFDDGQSYLANENAGYHWFQAAFGVDPIVVWQANDLSERSDRRTAVIRSVEEYLRSLGHDPDALRAEVVAAGG